MYEVILHINNTEPVLAEIEELPGPNDTLIKVSNPRARDGKDLVFLDHNVVTVYWPTNTLNFIEILPSDSEEDVFSFVRE